MSVKKVIGILALVIHLAFVINLGHLAFMAFEKVCVDKKEIIVHVTIGILVVLYHFAMWFSKEESR